MLCQTLSQTLKLAPHERPSTQPLTKNPQQLCYFLCQTLTKDPQQVWQTLKNFDYPIYRHGRSGVNTFKFFHLELILYSFSASQLINQQQLEFSNINFLLNQPYAFHFQKNLLFYTQHLFSYTYLLMKSQKQFDINVLFLLMLPFLKHYFSLLPKY